MKLSKSLEGFKFDAVAGGMSPRTAERAEYAIRHIIKFLQDPDIEKDTSLDLKKFFHYSFSLGENVVPNHIEILTLNIFLKFTI